MDFTRAMSDEHRPVSTTVDREAEQENSLAGGYRVEFVKGKPTWHSGKVTMMVSYKVNTRDLNANSRADVRAP